MKTRRLFAVAAAGALAVTGLVGCRSNPGVAAYVGAEKVTEKQVDEVLADVTRLVDKHNAALQATPSPSPTPPPEPGQQPQEPPYEAVVPTRERVVSTLVFTEVCRQAKPAPGEPAEAIAEDEVARAEQLPKGSKFVKARVEYYLCLNKFGGEAPPVVPTEDQLRDLYARGVAAKVFEANQPFEAVGPQLAANEQVRGAYGMRKALDDAVAASRVTVNPRYQPLELPILVFSQNETAVAVPLSPADPAPAVLDIG